MPPASGNVNGSQGAAAGDAVGSGAGPGQEGEAPTTPQKPVKPVNMASGKRSIIVNACQVGPVGLEGTTRKG